jgi:hypothetical protein
MEKINNTTKIKLICLLFFSNISVYLLTSPSLENDLHAMPNPTFQIRKGYTEMRIRANLLTSYSHNKPISLISKNKSIYIPYGILTGVDTPTVPSEFSDPTSIGTYTVYLNKKFIPLLISNPTLNIIPYAEHNITKAKRRNFEISI